MKRETIDLSEERTLISNAIVSTDYLRELSAIFDVRLLESGYAKQVSQWILDYWDKYKKAPGSDIQGIARQMLRTIPDEDTAEDITEFLQGLSDDYSPPHNLQYAIKQGENYLKIQNLKRLSKRIEQAVIAGNPSKGENALADFSRIGRTGSGHIDVLRDATGVAKAFMEHEEILYSFPGILGDVIGNFVRGDLVAFLGFTNKGKTWWQLYVAQLAAVHGLNAFFISVEQPDAQLRRRAWQMVSGQPRKAATVKIPYFEEAGTDSWEIEYKEEFREAPDTSKITQIQKKQKLGYRGGTFTVQSMPAFATTYNDIEALLESLEYYDNYLPDVMVIDYADIIVPSGGGKEHRHQLDHIWKSLRGLAQRKNILICTATQSGRKGASKDVKQEDIAEDIRKLNHVSKLISLNQNKQEYKQGIMRLSSLKERDGYRDFRQVGVLQCLEIGKPYIDSRLYSEIIMNEEE